MSTCFLNLKKLTVFKNHEQKLNLFNDFFL